MIPNKICLCLPASICYFCCSNPWQYCKEPHLAELLLGTSQIGCIVPPAKSKASHRIPVRRIFSYHFKSTEQLFSVKSSHTQVDLPIRSFLAGHHRGVESWEVTGGVGKTWVRHATTMGFGFLGFEFMSGMYDMYMWCHTCHTFKWRTTHVYCVLSTLMYAMKLLPDWKVMKFKLFYWMMSRPNNEKLKRCVTKTKHHNKSYRSQITILYTVHFTHLRIPGKCIPSWHASESHCRAFVRRAISCTTQSLQSMLGRGAKRSVLRRYGCGQHRKILWLYQQTMKQIQCFIWLMSFMDCPLDHARNHWKKVHHLSNLTLPYAPPLLAPRLPHK